MHRRPTSAASRLVEEGRDGKCLGMGLKLTGGISNGGGGLLANVYYNVFYREMCHLMQMEFEQEDDHMLTSTDTKVSFIAFGHHFVLCFSHHSPIFKLDTVVIITALRPLDAYGHDNGR